MLVAAALGRQGWTLLAQNRRHIGYELDLVVAKGSTLAIVEVKARSLRPQTVADGEALLPPAKRRALRRGAAAFLAADVGSWVTVRFDLAVVYPEPQTRRPMISYHVNVMGMDAER